MTTAVIAVSEKGFTAYGQARDFFYSREPEIILEGPYDTGKTITALHRLNLLLGKYDGARGLMVRKTYKSLINSAVVTYERKVHRNQFAENPSYPIRKYGGEYPQAYEYPNGSRLVLGGLDNPGKTLSSEYDFIYVNQAEELTADEWQALTRAASGRAGNAPYAQVMADCNPDVPEHWILKRARLKRYKSLHRDNPDIYNQETGELINPKRIAALQAMTGVRYKRGFLGLWVGREGQVYEYDPAVHLVDRFEPPQNWRWYGSVDFGYTNPFVFQLWAMDGDGRLYLYKEIYMSQRTIAAHVPQIEAMIDGRSLDAIVSDHDAEDRATLAEHGIYTRAADKRLSVGIEKVQERLKVQGDGKPRLFIMRDATVETDTVMESRQRPTATHAEFAGYVWPETKAQRAADEKPVKADDHGMDAMRYMVMHFDGRTPPSFSDLADLGKVEDYEPLAR